MKFAVVVVLTDDDLSWARFPEQMKAMEHTVGVGSDIFLWAGLLRRNPGGTQIP
jgi:hypothetical protein